MWTGVSHRFLRGRCRQHRLGAPRGPVLWQKTQNAAAAGAVATVIYNSEPGDFLATLTFTTDIPAVSVSLEDGTLLLDLLAAAPVTVHLIVETMSSESTSQNVIGTLEGTDEEQGIVYLAAIMTPCRRGWAPTMMLLGWAPCLRRGVCSVPRNIEPRSR